MRVALFQSVRQQYGFCCGYCGISETDAGATLTVDHYHPRTLGGSDNSGNLVESHGLRLIVFNPDMEEIEQWIK